MDVPKLYEQLTELKRSGCEGVMADIWWGIVEREGPTKYDWTVRFYRAPQNTRHNIS